MQNRRLNYVCPIRILSAIPQRKEFEVPWLVGWLVGCLIAVAGTKIDRTATAPPSAVIAPAAYYMLFAVSEGIPSVAQWVHVG
jgi:hypothetical protein